MSDGVAEPLVSIIVPSYNQGRYIAETIASILSQDYQNIELLVIDGASQDETLDVLAGFERDPRLRWISEQDEGVVDAVNKGLAMATGVYAAIQSSDDYYLPGAISAAIKVLEEDLEALLVVGDVVKVDEQGGEIQRTMLGPMTFERLLSMRTWIPQPSTFFRLSSAKAHGGWRSKVPYAADTDLWFRMALVGKVRKIDRPMACRRQHGAQRDQQGTQIVRDFTIMVEDLLPRLSASPSLQRAARAGVLAIEERYGPPVSGVKKWIRLLRRARLHPPLLEDIGILPLFPGYFLFRATASRVLRGFLGRASPGDP